MKSKSKPLGCPTLRRRKWQTLTLPLLLASFAMMAGCADRVVVKTDFCTPWKPIFVSRADVLTDPTAKAIRDHDETGVKLGCWPAPAKAKPAPKR